MKRLLVVVAWFLAAHLCLLNAAFGSVLEVPANGGDASGIGYFSGWKCPPNDNITLVIDGGSPIPVATGIRRGDTSGICGNDGRNGYISQFNFNLLGDGNHTVTVRQNGSQFATATFHVTTLGSTFLSGASGTYTLPNFPQAGQSTTVEWSQGAQNFIIVGRGGPPPPASAQVRYGNNLVCNGSSFESSLSANGYTWVSESGFFSPYQSVNRTSLGPFVESNDSPCTNATYPGTFSLTPGRKYALVQTISSGSRILAQVDEGVALTDAELAEQALESDLGNFEMDAMIPGIEHDKTGEPATLSR